MKQIILIITLLLNYTAALFAQEDSISCVTLSNNLESVESISLPSPRGRGVGGEALFGLPLVAAGVIEMHDNKRFRSLRNDFVDSDYKHEWENYAQYSPAVVMLAMKALGVESKSSWGKLVTAGAGASAIQFCTTHAIKRIAKEERPDGSRNNSFPSGHTATAFMAATMLHHEYGDLSPWISIGGYTVATTTGVMRMVNNRHWMSDVLAGAGIGIVSAELGYWLADICFPKSNKSFSLSVPSLTDPERKPSFIALNTGIVVPLKKYPIDSPYATTATGATAGIEGAYFFDQHWSTSEC
ncbi:MAG: phosphatase PAP2 family protein [Prevotellaceae bacterium]|nr:phosphatase PAP2 family protein [Prevotellaceae bacterium]